MYDEQKREAAVRAMAHPDAVDQVPGLLEGFERVGTALGLDAAGRPPAGTVVARAAVLGAEVVRFAPPRAQVGVWTVGLLGVAAAASPQPVQERWSTEFVDVVWDGTAWKWAGLQHQEGPVPVGGAQQPSASQELAHLPPTLSSHG